LLLLKVKTARRADISVEIKSRRDTTKTKHKKLANTYIQIHIQAVFAVQNRESLIQNEFKNELYKYITGIIINNKHKLLIINGMPDHIHILFGMRPVQSLSELMQDIKGSSSKWINDNNLTKTKFSWQEGYGAFSYSKSQLPKVIKYIENQEEHHKKRSFLEEYKEFLTAFEIDYDERYIFKKIE
jgi:putative transposase